MVRHTEHRRTPLIASAISGQTLAVLLLFPALLAAEEAATVSFQYTIASADGETWPETCPDERAVKRAIEARIGYAPWAPSANRRIDTTVRRASRQLEAEILLLGPEGNLIGRRLITSDETCREIVEAAVLAIAIAIAPTLAHEPSDAPEASPVESAPSNRVADAPPTDGATPPTPHPEPTWLRPITGGIYVGGLGSYGATPAVSPGMTLGAGIRFGMLSVLLGARYDFPGEISVGPGRVAARQLVAEVATCLGKKVVLGCAGLYAGTMWSEGIDLIDAQREASAALFGLLRIATDVSLFKRTTLRLFAEITLPAIRQRLREYETESLFWQTPPVGATWGGTLFFTFFDGFGRGPTIQ